MVPQQQSAAMKLRYRGSRVNFLEDQVSRSSSSSSTADHSDTNNRSSEGRRQFKASGVERFRYRGHNILKSSSSSSSSSIQEEIVNKNCNPYPTKIILSKKGEKDGILWIIVLIVPICFLYILSTNSLIANLGKGGSSRDPKTKLMQKISFNSSMKKHQEDMMMKEYRFMEAFEDNICHDYPTLNIMSTVPVVIHQQKHNYYSGISRGQSTNNRKETKNNMVRQKRYGLSTR